MENYVIFFCDDCDRLAPAIAAFKKVHPNFTIHTSSDASDLIARIKRHQPDLLLLYFHDSGKTYVDVLKDIRETAEGNAIPILIYHDLPEAQELEKAFADFRSKRS